MSDAARGTTRPPKPTGGNLAGGPPPAGAGGSSSKSSAAPLIGEIHVVKAGWQEHDEAPDGSPMQDSAGAGAEPRAANGGEAPGAGADRDADGAAAGPEGWPGVNHEVAGPSQIELTTEGSGLSEATRRLRPWARLRRVVLHYVRFFRAFSVLRNMHVPLELDTSLLAKKERLGGGLPSLPASLSPCSAAYSLSPALTPPSCCRGLLRCVQSHLCHG